MALLGSVSEALGLLPEGVRLLAAVSGGADSTAMVAACAMVRGRAFCAGGGLRVVHVDHGLRPAEECAGDAAAVRALCGRLGIGCTVAEVGRGKIAAWAREKGSGIEAAARHFRREALRHEAERINADYILVAHTRDDALETVLMRALRGAGPRGLALMPRLCRFAAIRFAALPSGVLGEAQNSRAGSAGEQDAAASPLMILRPLRDVTRREVIAFLAEQGLSYRTDSTNADVRYLRNRIRRRLVPVLDEHFPEWRTGLLETAETQGLAADFIGDEAKKRARTRTEGGGDEPAAAVIENLDELPEILREEALFAAFDRLKDAGDERTARRRTVRDFARDERMRAADLGGGIRASRGLPVRVARDEAFYEKGCSLLIKDAGAYRIDGLLIQAANVDGGLVIHVERESVSKLG
jgi:tRNA(Ile)-lysidine synthase